MDTENLGSVNNSSNPGLKLARLAAHWMKMANDAKSTSNEVKVIEVESTTGIHSNHRE